MVKYDGSDSAVLPAFEVVLNKDKEEEEQQQQPQQRIQLQEQHETEVSRRASPPLQSSLSTKGANMDARARM